MCFSPFSMQPHVSEFKRSDKLPRVVRLSKMEKELMIYEMSENSPC